MRDCLFLNVLRGAAADIPPVWFMRQAGRYLPEYQTLRAKAGSFLDLCFDPALAAEATLQPVRRFDVDAAIVFADILLIAHALGQKLWFEEGEGPRLDPPVSASDLERFRSRDVIGALQPIFETVRRARARLAPEKALIGFAGAPWTVASYMLAGRSVRDPAALRAQYYRDPSFLSALIDLLTDRTIEYLIAQIDAGADAIQLFDTWAGGLPWALLDVLSVRPLDRISKAVRAARPETPVILFPKGAGERALDYATLAACDGFGIDYAMDPAWARAELVAHTVVQGGLDPLVVVKGGEAMKKAADVYLKLFHDAPYIFNLGHGLTPQTPPEHVAALVEFVRKEHR